MSYGPSPREYVHSICWEYKWDDTPEADVFGPYPTGTMIQWSEKGYFKGRAAVARQIDENAAQYTPVTDIDFSLFP